jgi:hypothetical protein
MTTSQKNTCSNCCHHQKQTKTVLVKEVYDTISEIDDVKVPFCRNKEAQMYGKEMSPDATCPLWEPAKASAGAERLAELDRLIARAERRHAFADVSRDPDERRSARSALEQLEEAFPTVVEEG